MKNNFRNLMLLSAFATVFVACKKDKEAEQVQEEIQVSAKSSEFADVHMCTELYPEGTTPRGATIKTKQWAPGTVIKVSLNGGTSFVRNKVIQFASEWEKYANIDFQFVTNDRTAPIRVSFVSGDGSWSYIGTDCKNISSRNATMNFGWFTNSTADSEFSRTAIHEFGHALGLIHEHQHPLANIPWDKPKVYAYYAGAPNYWSTADVDNNLFAHYSTTQTNYSAYDPASIMHYAIDDALTIGTYSVGWNTVLSSTDKAFIASVYPK